MGLEKKIYEVPIQPRNISDERILQIFRQACWDLYISNLPDPEIINVLPIKEKIGSQEFLHIITNSMDTRNWKIRFNKGNLPADINEENLEKMIRAVFHHEFTHFTHVPSDAITEAILIDAALKGFSGSDSLNEKKALQYASLINNILGDLIGDTLLAKEKFGRENLGEYTKFRLKERISIAKKLTDNPSLIWQTLIATYEKLWKEDLGLKGYVPKLSPVVEKASKDLVSILGTDWKDRKTWEDKTKRFATVLEPIIRMEDQKNLGGNDELKLPLDILDQLCHATEGMFFNEEKDPSQTSDAVLEAIYERNKKNPMKFAGTMAALQETNADESLRLMYRARARELYLSIMEKKNQRAQKSPSYRTSWNIGDPVIGKGSIEMIPSIMASGKPVPGLTTYKRKMDVSQEHGRLKMIPDLLLVIDSSSSMNWHPWADKPEDRGDFDKAILAAEAAALYALNHGGKVAAINFSSVNEVRVQTFTDNLPKIEKTIVKHYKGGTEIPVSQISSMIKKTKNPLLTCLMSDCEVNNEYEAIDAFSNTMSEHDSLAIFKINSGRNLFVNKMKKRGALIYRVNTIDNLCNIMIGHIKKYYGDEESE